MLHYVLSQKSQDFDKNETTLFSSDLQRLRSHNTRAYRAINFEKKSLKDLALGVSHEINVKPFTYFTLKVLNFKNASKYVSSSTLIPSYLEKRQSSFKFTEKDILKSFSKVKGFSIHQVVTTGRAVSLATDALFSLADTEKKVSVSCAQSLQKISVHHSHLNLLAANGASHQQPAE